MEVWPGASYPLGATWDGVGTNFALFSEVAQLVELCLLDGVEADGGPAVETRIALTEVDGFVRHGLLAPESGRDSNTATVCTVLGFPSMVVCATQPNCCSIPTPRRSRAPSPRIPLCSGMPTGFPATVPAPQTAQDPQ